MKEELPVRGWDLTVLEAIIDLGENAHDEQILRRLKGEGHKSLSLESLMFPIRRLEKLGLITHRYVDRERPGGVERLRFWTKRGK